MKAINGAAFRIRLKENLDECEQSGNPLLVMTQKSGREAQQMVVISKELYDTSNINKILTENKQ